MPHPDVIVVGLGVMGASACHHLARRGLRVLGLEQHAIGHALGSSHGASRMIRLAYYEHPDYVPLLRKAADLWHQLDAASPQRLFLRTGTLYLGAAGSPLITGSHGSAVKHHLPFELLDAAQVRRRWPQFTLPDDFVGFFEPSGGFLVPDRIISRYCALALADGADLRGHEPVVSWKEDGDGVEVTTPRGTYSAGRVLFCVGPWTDRVLSALRLPLVVTRQVMGWVWPKRPEMFGLDRFPTWAIDVGDGTLHYGFPLHQADLGLKVAYHHRGQPTNPDTVDRRVGEADEAEFRPALARYLPAADGPLLAMRTCLYTNTPDGHFVIDRIGPRAFVAAGFSGHGFKFASVVGKILADLASAGSTDEPIELFRADRFAK
jgi:sarcosine oxidase